LVESVWRWKWAGVFYLVEKVEAFALLIRKARESHVRCCHKTRKERVTPFARLHMPRSEARKDVNITSEDIDQVGIGR